MNLPQVQLAIHATQNISWVECGGINYNYTDVMKSVIPIYPLLISEGLQILIYTGDVDAIVPITGTRAWLKELNLPIVSPWQAYYVSEQTGGYYVEYKGLTFASVRNAGHMVPQTQPERALYMFSKFLYLESF